jgi:uncharacterized membrane protein
VRNEAEISVDARTADEAMREAKRPTTPLAGPYGRPLHPLAASLATGALVCSFGFDLISQVAKDPGVYTRGAYFLILAGVGFGLVAATLGLFDVLALPRDTPVFQAGVRHLVASDAAILIFLGSFLLRRFLIFIETPWSLVFLSLLGLLALSSASWSGLGLSYRWGVRVVDEAEQLPGFEPAVSAVANAETPAAEPAASGAGTDITTDDDADGDATDDEGSPEDGADVGVATHET